MYKLFDKIIDIWKEKNNNKMVLALNTNTTLPTIYKVLNKENYNVSIINQMWIDIEDLMTEQEKIDIIMLLNLLWGIENENRGY